MWQKMPRMPNALFQGKKSLEVSQEILHEDESLRYGLDRKAMKALTEVLSMSSPE